jgi:MATE family multidrug resistance protein
MFASVAAHWTFLPVIYLSLKVWGFSLPMSWFLLVLVFLLFCGLIVWRFRSGRWRKRTEELIG